MIPKLSVKTESV